MENKRLYRSTTDRKVAGVAGGLAEYFNMDSLLVRLIFVVLTLAWGTSVFIYIVLWIVTPEKPYAPSASSNQPNVENPPPPREEPKYSTEAPKKENPIPAPSSKKKGSLVGGLILITLGALFLADEFIPDVDFGDLWPVILIVIGAGLLINALTGKKTNDQ